MAHAFWGLIFFAALRLITAQTYSGAGCPSFYGNIDPNNEAYLRVLTRGQAYYDSATHQINILQGNSTPTPGPYLTKIIKKDFANQRLILHANNKNFSMTGPECFAQSKADFAAIGDVVASENDTIPESNTNGGIMLEGEPYYHHTLQANAAAFNPLVRLGQANANHPNPGKYLQIWITVAKGMSDFTDYVNGNDSSIETCIKMNTMLGNCFLDFLREPAF
ncbi:uncharacterized protein LOC129593968 [Paramacrobiotus metropolitanus]|uniref:uncharacterized protein LOC129593968 n=1 Tax=Paramacrobiotus metropolitanus TaxID=2943436 RepID=UPI002446265A|nr:uncharacterized protein LOC129593968 [Paramacrobiotus metropolitanus]